MKRIAMAMIAVAVLLGGAACGSDSKVGDESLLDFKEQVNEGLGESTTTTAPAAAATATTGAPGAVTTVTTAKAGGTQATATTATTQAVTAPTKAAAAATTTTTAKVEESVLEILIQSDGAEKAVDPEYARAYVGTTVKWVNKDAVARSVASTTGEFKSPAIPPGGTFEYKATKVGIFDYADGTRPYVNAILEILEG
jgi:plastocyanin